jgi:hypothetical protein
VQTQVSNNRFTVSKGTIPFGRSSTQTVLGRFLVHGATDLYQFLFFDTSSGEVARIVRLQREPQTLTRGDIARFRRSVAASIIDPNSRRRFERGFSDLPFPGTKPAFQTFVVDRLGFLWSQERDNGATEFTEWLVFQPDGRLRGSVGLPRGLRVTDIGLDYVVGIWSDSLGVEHVRVHSLDRT